MCVFTFCVSVRSSERRSPSCLLGAWSGHPVLPQLPAWVHCQTVQASLPCLWPRSVWWLLPRASASSIAGLGPPRACVHQLQPETWRTLTGMVFLPQSTRKNHSLSSQSVTAIPLLLKWFRPVSVERKFLVIYTVKIWDFRVPVAFVEQPEHVSYLTECENSISTLI